jgi:hypothetical protein
LNAWLGGFESIMKKMTPGNFNWFLHSMLYYHTKHVITKQEQKVKKAEARRAGSDSDETDDEMEQQKGKKGEKRRADSGGDETDDEM